ncbi:hypothetical protein ONS95_002590 [Cadophora gregata]|uniref:uncharacterized protein n=1 Tax=Cadophora gregata TaxID=51156 RepID=UPI0026DB9CED|nr:uncharacterized protein ONS95_002590 [Cadophora gregata]KAK0109919.1 hypothetical protein ONS95_002590 [Cadophora gregata]KAK0110451.1 hypothetical protein ONS96_002062 [Cadophora gregata f. sp. sojae]
MPYVSIFPLMKARAEHEGVVYWNLRIYYKERLMLIQNGASTVPQMTPETQQYRAENQTWSYFWPEDIFPGIDPQPGLSIHGSEYHSSQPGDAVSSSNPSHRALTTQDQQNASQYGAGHKLKLGSSKDACSPWTCGNCKEGGHTLADCTKNLDSHGFLPGCPVCNTLAHNYDGCQNNSLQERDHVKDFHFLVFRRIGKPPVRTSLDFRHMGNGETSKLRGMPQTYQFALERKERGLPHDPEEIIFDPTWKNNPRDIKDQSHPLDRIAAASLPARFNQGMKAGPAAPAPSQMPNARPRDPNHNFTAMGHPNTAAHTNTNAPLHMSFQPQLVAQQQQIPLQLGNGGDPSFQFHATPASHPPPPRTPTQGMSLFQQHQNLQRNLLDGNINPSVPSFSPSVKRPRN